MQHAREIGRDERLERPPLVVDAELGHRVSPSKGLLTQPANNFVYDLLGANDMVRQLGLLRVSSAMTDFPPSYSNGHNPTLSQNDSLRDALSLILRTGAPTLTVMEEDTPVGLLTLDHIRACAVLGEEVT